MNLFLGKLSDKEKVNLAFRAGEVRRSPSIMLFP